MAPMPRCSPLPGKCIIFLRLSAQEQSNVGVGAVSGGLHLLPGGNRTGWLRWSDSNSETSSQNIPLKGRSDCPDPAEFWPQRLFAFELRRPGDAARPRARTSAGVLARTLVIELPSLRWQELPRFSADSEMIRRPPIQQHHCSLGTGLFPQRERVLWSRTASLSGLLLSPPRAPWASAGVGWWRRDVAPARFRGVLHVQAQTRANRQGAGFIQSSAEGSPQRRAHQAGEFEAGAGAGTAAPAEWRHHCNDHDFHRLAAALGAGVFCW